MNLDNGKRRRPFCTTIFPTYHQLLAGPVLGGSVAFIDRTAVGRARRALSSHLLEASMQHSKLADELSFDLPDRRFDLVTDLERSRSQQLRRLP